MRPRFHRLAEEGERSDVRSDADGVITFNHLQQSEPEPDLDDGRPATETTDPWGITDSEEGP